MNHSDSFIQGGKFNFLGLELEVAPGVLVPRSETEILGRAALAQLAELPKPVRVIDMCCGSGNLACALGSQVDGAEVWASDLTDPCVHTARGNVVRLGLGGKVKVFQGDLFAGLAGQNLEGTIDLIVCNPPYISTGKLQTEKAYLLEHEPVEAFDGGPYGLTIHQRVAKEGLAYLKAGGWLMFEFGIGQHKPLEFFLGRLKEYTDLTFFQDAEGNPRAARLRKL